MGGCPKLMMGLDQPLFIPLSEFGKGVICLKI